MLASTLRGPVIDRLDALFFFVPLTKFAMIPPMRSSEFLRLGLFCFAALLISVSTEAHNAADRESPTMRQFVRWESENNPGSRVFDQNLFDIPHIEIPLEEKGSFYLLSDFHQWFGNEAAQKGPHALIIDFADYLPEPIRNSLIFERDGKKYIRYLLSPDDNKYGPRITDYLEKLGIPYEGGHYFIGRRTASRSIIAIDPDTGHSFSFKPSTNQVPHGKWNDDRVFPIRWAHLNRRLSDYFKQMEPQLKYLKIAHEAAAVGFPPLDGGLGDTAISIRLMEEVSSGKNFHFSGFVLEDPAEVRRLADQAQMPVEAFMKKLGNAHGGAMAELTTVLGFRYTSDHAQNLRFELDLQGQPTGKAILLDLSDGRPMRPVFERNGQQQLLEQWEFFVNRSNPITEYWAPEMSFRQLGDDSFGEEAKITFKKRMNELTPISLDELTKRPYLQSKQQIDAIFRYHPPTTDLPCTKRLSVLLGR